MTSCPCLFHDPGVVSPGPGGVDGPLRETGPLVGLFVTWVPGVDARSGDRPTERFQAIEDRAS